MTCTFMTTLARGTLAALLLLSAACAGDDAADTGASASATTTTAATDATTGGTASASGTTTDATTDATTDTGAPVGTCEGDEGCQLVNDCCACAALPIDAPVERCPMDCLIGSCEAMGLSQPAAACRLGVCALAPQPCDPGQVACDALPPDCPEGQAPTVIDGCWGACVPARLCDVLPACTHDLCGPGWMCVESQAGAFRPHCEPIPAACAGTAACGCAAAEFAAICLGGCEDAGASLLCADGG